MYSIETVVREVKGTKKEVKMLFGTGRLTNDPPSVQEVNGGYKVLRGSKEHHFSIAFSNGKDKDATFYPLVAWDKLAENLAKLGFKGQLIEVAGRIETRPYKAQDGTERTFESLVIEKFDVKQYKDGNNSTNADEQKEATNEQPPQGFTEAETTGVEDDIPF